MNDSARTETIAAAELAMLIADTRTVGDTPIAILPQGASVRELSHLLSAPPRKKGTVTLRDLDSFVRLVNAEKSPQTRIYGTQQPPELVAVFNDHAGELTGWCDHRAVYSCPLSEEWKRWQGSNGKRMTQEQFATFIEDNARDIVNPSAAEMLEVARTLQIKNKVSFASGIRLDNGEMQLRYEEQIEGMAGAKGDIRIPEEFKVGMSFTLGGPQYLLRARLRYRIEGAKLALWYDLDAPHKVVEDAVKELFAIVGEQTGLPVFHGQPE